ncbi:MAG: hypothetical protein KBD94_08645 [Pyrinomonadaceae bacterium]|nr:hypothetical protein [Pyrinomonadaceae bacterium]
MEIRRPTLDRFIRLFVVGGITTIAVYLAFDGMGANRVEAQKTVSRSARNVRKDATFSHGTDGHRNDCTSCHSFPSGNWKIVRSENTAFPDITDYPRHESCVNCHRQQFFTGRSPQICSVCHQVTSPDGGVRHPFPNPREIFDKSPKAIGHDPAFAVFFPHDKHIGIVSGYPKPKLNGAFVNVALKADEASCAVCHSTIAPQGDSVDEFVTPLPKNWGTRYWLKKGTFKSAPTGHQQCFTCHSAEGGMAPTPAECGTCHKPIQTSPRADFDPQLAAKITGLERGTQLIWKQRISSGKYRHDFAMHADLECSTCHTVESINTTDPISARVAIGTCAMCHVTATAADGGVVNIELEERKKNQKFDCVMCHITFGRRPIPESHSKAVTGN